MLCCALLLSTLEKVTRKVSHVAYSIVERSLPGPCVVFAAANDSLFDQKCNHLGLSIIVIVDHRAATYGPQCTSSPSISSGLHDCVRSLEMNMDD